jgi:hypothetical protein
MSTFGTSLLTIAERWRGEYPATQSPFPSSPDYILRKLEFLEVEFGITIPDDYRIFLLATAALVTNPVDAEFSFFKVDELKIRSRSSDSPFKYLTFADWSLAAVYFTMAFRGSEMIGVVRFDPEHLMCRSFSDFMKGMADPEVADRIASFQDIPLIGE